MKEKKQIPLIQPQKDWEKEWKNMPEFIQKDLTSDSSIIVHFSCLKDREDFGKIINQKITSKTKSIWFPKIEFESVINKIYIDQEGDINENK